MCKRQRHSQNVQPILTYRATGISIFSTAVALIVSLLRSSTYIYIQQLLIFIVTIDIKKHDIINKEKVIHEKRIPLASLPFSCEESEHIKFQYFFIHSRNHILAAGLTRLPTTSWPLSRSH